MGFQVGGLPEVPATEEPAEDGWAPCSVPPQLQQLPWLAGLQCMASLAAAAVGLWLLFGTPVIM